MKITHIVIANANRNTLLCKASDKFGGATITEVSGGWLDPNINEVLVEPGYQISIASTVDREMVITWAKEYAHSIGEHAILVWYGNHAEIINTEN